MKTTEEAKLLIKSFESLKLPAYKDGWGKWTIGWGHTHGVKPGQTITLAEAQRLFEQDVGDNERLVKLAVTHSLNDNEFSALVSLVFNIGYGRFLTSTLLKHLNMGDMKAAAAEFLKWDHVGGAPVHGLTRRRLAEQKLFLTEPRSKLLT